ncbi:hypothetical protein [Moheibacter stercoris]|uniref:Lipoprotein n=1 Tax=Moheibacter stercoris TaxID=1628251 RepID=A0ABV2LVP7_9FLAO
MRCFYKLPSLLLLFLLFVACNFNSENYNFINKPGIISSDDAVAIIHYNNGLVELTDAQLEYITYVNRNLKLIETGLVKSNEPILISKITDVFYFNIKELSDVNKELPRSVFDKSQIEYFEKNVQLMNQTFEDVRMRYQILENYILNQEYLADKGIEGVSQLKALQKVIDVYFDMSDLVMDRIVDLSNEAEKEVIKDHPLKDFIYAMQESSDLVSFFVDRAVDRSNLYEEDKAVYKQLLVELKIHHKKIAEMDQNVFKEFSEKRIFFEGYLGALNDFIILGEKVTKQTNISGNFSNEQINELLISEEFLRNFYNDFVD